MDDAVKKVTSSAQPACQITVGLTTSNGLKKQSTHQNVSRNDSNRC